jgi:uncharacterized protein YndB with AHSA1/START domain
MSGIGTATASVEVSCDPKTAFTVFTEEIADWWRRGTMYWSDAERGLALRFEPHVGGRLIEVYDASSGEGFEVGRVTAWEPGERVAFTWRTDDWDANLSTDVNVTFTATSGGTRVTIAHSGWERLGAAGEGMSQGYSRGWKELLGWYAERA